MPDGVPLTAYIFIYMLQKRNQCDLSDANKLHRRGVIIFAIIRTPIRIFPYFCKFKKRNINRMLVINESNCE